MSHLQSHSLSWAAHYRLSQARCCPAEGKSRLSQCLAGHKSFRRERRRTPWPCGLGRQICSWKSGGHYRTIPGLVSAVPGPPAISYKTAENRYSSAARFGAERLPVGLECWQAVTRGTGVGRPGRWWRAAPPRKSSRAGEVSRGAGRWQIRGRGCAPGCRRPARRRWSRLVHWQV
jgi:hypothetical protein